MSRTALLHGLTAKNSLIAVWKLLFSPALQTQLGEERTLFWCDDLIGVFAAGNQADFTARYNSMAGEVKAASAGEPKPSIEHPPRSIISIDMVLGMFPWVTPIFDQFLFLFFQKGSASFRGHEILPMAFVLSGGPGDTKDTAIRICAPSNAARVSAEYWLRRGYLWTREEGPHFTLEPDENGRTFSKHCYTDTSGENKTIYFDTTNSFGREKDDFEDFLCEDIAGISGSRPTPLKTVGLN